MKEHFFIYNGLYFQQDVPVISAGNRSLNYGDGLFETIRVLHGRILLEEFHFERLFHGLKLLQIFVPGDFTSGTFISYIHELILKNHHPENARVRLMVFRNVDVEEKRLNFIIESWPLEGATWSLNETGLVVDVYPEALKSCDRFSNLKSNNYLQSLMAELSAKNNHWDDCVLLNSFGRICESSIANIFIIEGKNIYTPQLSEGCVAGVTRRWLLQNFKDESLSISEREISIDELLNADEIFLTNAIKGIRWVKSFGERDFKNKLTLQLSKLFFKKI